MRRRVSDRAAEPKALTQVHRSDCDRAAAQAAHREVSEAVRYPVRVAS